MLLPIADMSISTIASREGDTHSVLLKGITPLITVDQTSCLFVEFSALDYSTVNYFNNNINIIL